MGNPRFLLKKKYSGAYGKTDTSSAEGIRVDLRKTSLALKVEQRIQPDSILEGQAKAKLCGEGNAHSGARAEEIAEGAGRNEQLLAVRYWHGAGWIRTKRGDVREIIHRNGKSADITDIVVPGIIAVE